MKNLKKVLALVLVVVMALGLITVTNAADFTDAQSVTKAEAVDVLSAIGVINGYPDGSFKPEGEVTRAEMAKMVATIMNKGEDVGELYKNACKFADSANHWAAGYIAYCAQAGIINGKSATVFDPDGKVTGTEAAKMLLCALGYKADAEGFVGANWASAVLARAAEAHLVGKTYNMTANMAEPLNRENTAQMMLNALKADMVKYTTSGTTITGNGFTINTGSDWSKKTDTNKIYGAINRDGIAKNEDATEKNPFVIQLGEEMFEGDLKLEGTKEDSFGRPAQKWTYKSNEISRAPKAADLEYKDVVKGGTLYSDLGKVKFEDAAFNGGSDTKDDKYAVVYYKNGAKVDPFAGKEEAGSKVDKLIKSAGKAEFGQVGDTIEAYIDSTEELITIVEVDYFVGTITNVLAAKTNSAGDVTKAAYVTLDTADSGATKAYTYEDTTIPQNSFATAAFTDADIDAVVIYTIGHDTEDGKENNIILKSVAKAETATGLFTSSVAGDPQYDTVTVAGTTYKVTPSVKDHVNQNQDVTVYLDPNGNVAKIEGITSDDYVYMIQTDEKDNGFNRKTDMARLIFSDGTVKEAEFKMAKDSDGNEYAKTADKLYTYTKDAKDVYTLTPVTAKVAAGAGAWKKGEAENSKVNYFSGVNYFDGDTETAIKVRANNDTKFVVETFDSAAKAATYAVYTGINNLPTIKAADYQTFDADEYKDGGVIKNTTAACAGSEFVAVKSSTEDYASIIYIFGASTKSSSTKVTALFYGAKDSKTTDADGNDFYTAKAVADGAETTVKMTTTAHETALKTAKFVVADSLTLDTNGTVEGFGASGNVVTYGPFAYTTGEGGKYTGTYKGGIVTLTKIAETGENDAEMIVDANLPVYVYNVESGEITITTIGSYVPAGDPSDDAFKTGDRVKVLNDGTNNKNVVAFYVWETNE